MVVERRTNRSDARGPALDLQLESVRRSLGLPALVLADTHGLVVAAAGPSSLSEVVAARAAAVPTDPELSLVRFSAFGDDFALAAPCRVAADVLDACRRGLQRILFA